MQYVSASQIELYLRCPRKWVRGYGRGRTRPPETESQGFGKTFHGLMERAVRDGDPMPEQSAPFLEEVLALVGGRPFQVEAPVSQESVIQARERGERTPSEPFVDLTVAGVPVAGYVDLRAGDEGDRLVLDYKTARNGKYCLTPEGLTRSAQMMLYALAEVLDGAQAVHLVHGYFFREPRKRDGQYYFSSAEVTADEVMAFHDLVLLPTVENMKALYDMDADPDDVSDNGRVACWDYGGCEYGPRGDGSCRILNWTPGAR